MRVFLTVLCVLASGCAIRSQQSDYSKKELKMKVEVWSDVMCPFCYIGKRKFELALEKFEHRDKVEVEWKSFQLNPNLVTDTSRSVNEYLAAEKGWTLEYTQQMSAYVSEMAQQVGLNYKLDKAVLANSMDAHRLSHLAKEYGKQDELEELLFKAYFIEGKNTADREVLKIMGGSLGIDAAEIDAMFDSEQYVSEVNQDILESQQLGVTGVPFYAFDRKYGVSGAQDVQAFLETLEKSYEEWGASQQKIEVSKNGQACTPDGECK